MKQSGKQSITLSQWWINMKLTIDILKKSKGKKTVLYRMKWNGYHQPKSKDSDMNNKSNAIGFLV